MANFFAGDVVSLDEWLVRPEPKLEEFFHRKLVAIEILPEAWARALLSQSVLN